MHRDRPIIDHIRICTGGKWITRTFLPFFDDVLIWAEDIDRGKGCPYGCPLSNHAHPCVRDDRDEYCWHKLCTLTVIRAGLMTREEALGDR